MNCRDIAEREVAEKYITGQLSQVDQEAYEMHFFECRDCTAALEELQAIQRVLAHQATSPSASTPVWRWAVAAAAILAILGIWTMLRAPEQPPQAQVHPSAPARFDLLARLDPPRYTEPSLRGADDAQAKFREGMRFYQKGDYAAAIPSLEAAAKLNRGASSVQFFLGVCYLLSGNRAQGADHLHQVAADSIEAGDAHFYLAKALLAAQDPHAATEELSKAIAAKSALADEARRLIVEIQRLQAVP